MVREADNVRLRFDFADSAGRVSPLLFERPVRMVVAHRLDEVRPALRAIEHALGKGRHAAGFVAYEAAPAFDPALPALPPADVPLVWFGIFDAPVMPSAAHLLHSGLDDRHDWTADITLAEYRRGVAAVRDAIARGDVYQANYTFRLRARLDPDPGSLEVRYAALVAEHRPSYAAFLDIGRWRILSLSPELFFRMDGRRIVLKPMKGTASRGLWADDDVARAADLRTSVKNLAENVMIVDLVRNDVGRIAEVGSVRAPALFEVEGYPSLFQMVSTVEARLRPEVTTEGLFAALFPAGSITGAPKTSSMRLIAAIERAPRGVYCGAIGFFSPEGRATFNVAIRTVTVDGRSGRAEYGVGGGITWDSVPDEEHAEAVGKAGCLTLSPRFQLIETMRSESGLCRRLDRHLRRLGRSAAYFGFVCDLPRIEAALAVHAAGHPHGTRRVRLLLSRNGDVSIESHPLGSPPASPPRVALAAAHVRRNDRFLYHKTTRREVYEASRAARPGAFDILLWNEDGELTEFTIGNLVVERDGVRWTPPVRSGLLAGVFREALLESGAIRERVLVLDDLGRADGCWLINSVREWVRVQVDSA